MRIDLRKLQRMADESVWLFVQQVLGRDHVRRLEALLRSLPVLFSRWDLEAFASTLVVHVPLEPYNGKAEEIFESLEELVARLEGANHPLCIRLLEGERYALEEYQEPEQLSEHSIVYQYRRGGEALHVRRETFYLINPVPSLPSIYARPSFNDLIEALRDYARRVRHSSCHILRLAWYDEKRLYFHAGPEVLLRRSLDAYLQVALRDADTEIRPEQNTDESHPVDIKITWASTRKIAIIEVKWLGKSRTDIAETAVYADKRARDGAKQLAEYLDNSKSFAPDRITKGYLVLFDARRWGLKLSRGTISRKAGLYYESRDVVFSPRYHETRSDMAEPVRIFLEPVCDA